jgi:hypothetical protein
MPPYGPLISTPIIEAGALETLRLYLPAYLGDALAQAGHDRFALPDPEDTHTASDEIEQAHESQFSLLVVATPGTDGDAQINGGAPYDATYSARWELITGVVCNMTDYIDTRHAAGFYAASTMCLAHKGLTAPEGLPGAETALPEPTAQLLTSCSVEWLGEQIRNRTPDGSQRTVMLGSGRFHVWVPDARARWGGPATPPPAPERPGPDLEGSPETVNVETEKVDIENGPP